MTNFNILRNNLEELSLTKMLEVLPNVMDNSAKNKVPLADSLLERQSQILCKVYTRPPG